jgi:site-specific recombinase XerD
MITLDFTAPLSKYFRDDIAASLEAKGIESLDDVFDLVMSSDQKVWARVLGWDEKRANGLIEWLYRNRTGNFELSDKVVRRARDLQQSYYRNSCGVEDISRPQWDDVITPPAAPSVFSSPFASRQSPVLEGPKPLEYIQLPELFNGKNGTNRGDRENCALQSDDDVSAIQTWLKARANNPNTLVAYRKEAERFLLWSVLEKQTALSSLSLEDCSDYLRWLEMLGRTAEDEWSERWREPQKRWIGPKNALRASAEWRPFNSALSYSSRKTAFTVVRQLFTFLQKTGYLKFNPFDQISPKIPLLPGEGKPKEFADRSLSKDQWSEVLEYLESLPESLQKARLEVILLLGKGLGMRASEMLNARSGWIDYKNLGGQSVPMISIVGKGDKERALPLQDEQVDRINRYLALRKKPLIGDPEGADTPLLASLRKKKNTDPEVLSRSGLYVILANFLEEVAVSIQKERPLDASKLRTSSTHWLRHTFAVTSLEVMPVNVVQNALGHASVGTTSRYIMPDQKEILDAMKKKDAL